MANSIQRTIVESHGPWGQPLWSQRQFSKHELHRGFWVCITPAENVCRSEGCVDHSYPLQQNVQQDGAFFWKWWPKTHEAEFCVLVRISCAAETRSSGRNSCGNFEHWSWIGTYFSMPGGYVTPGHLGDTSSFSGASFVVGYFPDFFLLTVLLALDIGMVGPFPTLQCCQQFRENKNVCDKSFSQYIANLGYIPARHLSTLLVWLLVWILNPRHKTDILGSPHHSTNFTSLLLVSSHFAKSLTQKKNVKGKLTSYDSGWPLVEKHLLLSSGKLFHKS